MASNVMTVLLKGDLILSVTMTTLATLLTPLVIAVWLPLLADARMDVPVVSMAWNATWMVVLPVAAGIAFRAWRSDLTRRWDRSATLIASVAIVLIILVVVAANRDRLATLGPKLALAMLGLNLAAYGLAFLVATALRWPAIQRRTLVIEVGMQNGGMATGLAFDVLQSARAAMGSATFGPWSAITASVLASWWRREPADETGPDQSETPREET